MKVFLSKPPSNAGFTLIEVMIALGIFVISTFAILGVIGSGLANVRRLQRPPIDAGVVAAYLSATNKLTEGSASGSMADILGKEFQNYTWVEKVEEVETNKLYRIDCAIVPRGSKDIVSQVSFLMYSPQSDAGSMDGGMHHR